MTGWADGYVVDQDYSIEVQPELMPAHLAFAALERGVAPPDLAGPFTYCDLGAGRALGAMMVAAAHPEGRVVAIDFNPAHVVWARRLAAAAGLANFEALELSFADAAEAGLPRFDLVVLHGVYSWVSPENRAQIRRFLAERVRPGGLVALSYNALPGRAMLAPLRDLLARRAVVGRGGSGQRVAEALTLAQALAESGATALARNPFARQKLEELAGRAPAYLAHEYTTADWHPFHAGDVMAEMAEAKLGFVGSADLVRRASLDGLTAEQRQLAAAQPEAALRELVEDYCLNTAFRTDLYSRGGARLAPAERTSELGRLALGLTRAPGRIETARTVQGRHVELEADAARCLVDALSEGPRPMAELVAALGGAEAASAPILRLIASAQAVPLSRSSRPAPASRRLNGAIRRLAAAGAPLSVLASGLGASLEVGAEEQLWLGCLPDDPTETPDPAAMAAVALAEIAARGERPEIDGVPLPEAAARAQFARRAAWFLETQHAPLAALGVAASGDERT